MEENIAVKVQWTSRVDFVVALLGYSIGMPEFWRVPYLTYRNGGGPFIVVYILLMVICGLPLYFLELGLSQYSGKGPWRFWDICPLLRGLGIAIAVINGLSAINTAIMEAWAFEYFVNSFKLVLPWTNCDNVWNTHACFRDGFNTSLGNTTFYINTGNYSVKSSNASFLNQNIATYRPVDPVDEFWLILRVSNGIQHLGSINMMYVVYLFVMRVIAALTIVKSVESMGKVLYVTALLPVALVLMIWIRALTLPGAAKGMLFFVSFDFARFIDAQLWIEAAFQTFLTLGPGWGGLMMMGAHNKFRTDCFKASVISTSATLTFGLVNSLVVFSVLGVMSEEIGIPISDVLKSGGFSIGFIAYPKALSYFPLPQFWCAVFYVVMLLPGLDAMSILTEPLLMILEEMCPKFLGNRRIQLLSVVSLVMFVAGIPFASKAGVYIFLLVDWYTGTWSVMLICLSECIIFAWVYGSHRLDRDLRLMLGRPLPIVIRLSIAFLMPVFLTFLLLISIFTYKPPSFGIYTYPVYARVIGWCFTASSLIPAIGYSIWIIKKIEGTLSQRLKRLVRHTNEWSAADEKAHEIHKATEKVAEFTWKKLFWYNLTGKGGIKMDSTPLEEEHGSTPMI